MAEVKQQTLLKHPDVYTIPPDATDADLGFVIMKHAPGILLLDDQDRIIYVNDTAVQMLGYEYRELTGRSIEIICPSGIHGKITDQTSQDPKALQAHWIERKFVTRDRLRISVDLHVQAVDVPGATSPMRVVLLETPLYRNISEAGLNAEDVLRMNPGVVWSLFVEPGTLHTVVNYYSPNIQSMLGRPPVDLRDSPLLIFRTLCVHPDDRAEVLETWRKIVENRESKVYLDNRILHPDGKTVWVRNLVHITWTKNHTIRLDGLMIDISDAKKIELELTRRDEILTALGKAAQVLLAPVDWDSGINTSITALGHMLKARHVRIFKNWYEEDEIFTSLRYEWTADDAQPMINDDRMQRIPFKYINDVDMVTRLIEERVYKGFSRDISSPALRKTLDDLSMASIMLIPIYLRGGRWWGVLVFDHSDEERFWTDDEEDAMKTAADMIGAAMIRRREENELRSSQERYRTLVDMSPYAVIYVDLEWQIELANAQSVILFGYARREDLIGKNWMDLLESDSRDEISAQTDTLLEKGDLRNLECTCIRQPGTRFPAEISISLMRNTAGSPAGFICIHHDISERKISETALTSALSQVNGYVHLLKLRNHVNTLFTELMNRLQSCMTLEDIYALTGDYMEKIFPEHTGALYIYNEGQHLYEAVMGWGENLPGEIAFPPDDCCAVKQHRTHLVSDIQTRLRCKHVHTQSYICLPLIHAREIIGVLHMQDMSESPSNAWKQQMLASLAESTALAIANLRLRQTLEYQSTHDHLTGLYNSRYLDIALNRELRRAERLHTTVCLALLNVNHFRNINDLYGRRIGDEILRMLGNMLHSRIRGEDIICHFGGDEFLLILTDTSLEEGFWRAMEFCWLKKDLSSEKNELPLENISFSFGIAAYPRHGTTAEELIKAAEGALYQLKREDREGGLAASDPS